jgi:hypothetical protein
MSRAATRLGRMARPPRFIGQGRGLAMAAPAGTPVSNSGMAREGDDRGGPPVGEGSGSQLGQNLLGCGLRRDGLGLRARPS